MQQAIAWRRFMSPYGITRPQWVKQTTWSSLQWRRNGRDGVSNHQPHNCLLNRLFGRRSKKTPKLRVTGICAGNSPVTSEFPTQKASNAENVSIWWRHHDGLRNFWTYTMDSSQDFASNYFTAHGLSIGSQIIYCIPWMTSEWPNYECHVNYPKREDRLWAVNGVSRLFELLAYSMR